MFLSVGSAPTEIGSPAQALKWAHPCLLSRGAQGPPLTAAAHANYVPEEQR